MSRNEFVDKFQKAFQKDQVAITQADSVSNIQSIPTGILSFDTATGIGGFPRGRIVEVFGPESGGKSLLTLVAVAYAQEHFGANALYYDIEGGTPREWLETIGVNLQKFDIIPAGLAAEQNLDALVMAIENKAYDYIILDSVAGLVSRAELEGDIDKNYMAELARAMSKGLKKIVSKLAQIPSNEAPCVIFINQIREKPGVTYGNPETTPGGRALKFYSSQRYRVKRKYKSETTENGDIAGHTIAVGNEKNKLGPPKREGEFFIHYINGVDVTKSIMAMVKQRKLYTKVGQKYELTLEDDQEPITFGAVGEIETKIREEKEFQEKVYDFLMSTYTPYAVSEKESLEADFSDFDKKEEN